MVTVRQVSRRGRHCLVPRGPPLHSHLRGRPLPLGHPDHLRPPLLPPVRDGGGDDGGPGAGDDETED